MERGQRKLTLMHRFALLSLPLLLFPRILVFFSQTPPAQSLLQQQQQSREDHYDDLTPLERFLALSLSLGLLAQALTTLLVLVPTYEDIKNPGRTVMLGKSSF